MMYRIPGMLVLPEPDAITTLGFLYKDKLIQRGEYAQLLASSVRLLCKPDDRFSAVFIKGRPSTTGQIEDVFNAFPRFRYLFMYRNSIKSIMSSISFFQQDPAPKAIRFIMDNSMLSMFLPFVRWHYYYFNTFLNDKPVQGVTPKKLDTVGIFTAAWAASVARCADLRYKGFPIGSILYEDFMKNPRRSLSILMQMLDIKREYLGVASEALKVDFNRGPSYESSLETRRIMTPDSRQHADNVMKAYGLPKLGERYELAGLLKLE